MKYLIAFALLVAGASASVYRRGVYYGGLYPGYCPLDGYYYYDANSYIQCDNGKHAIRQCAPGTKNGPASSYKANTYYSTGSVFCDLFADAEVAEEEPAEEVEEAVEAPKLPLYAFPNAGRYGARYGRYGYPAVPVLKAPVYKAPVYKAPAYPFAYPALPYGAPYGAPYGYPYGGYGEVEKAEDEE